MRTITFYSYKGGAGRSLALANAVVYLAKLGFNVVALDLDLEAPGLHYKLSRDEEGSPLSVTRGVIDYVTEYLANGKVDRPVNELALDVPVPGADAPVRLIPAGRVPSREYWAKLARINWHDIFYSREAPGVGLFMELKARILDELRPDFLLVDARTGITEMGGVATALFADEVICLVLPTLENLHGARAVLRGLRRSRRELRKEEVAVVIALSRLPQTRGSDDEREVAARILGQLNEEAEDPADTLHCESVFVLHSEPALQLRESLRVGSGITPDESLLLRDYLRLFSGFVPKAAIEPKVRDLIEEAWEKLRTDPDAAVKDMEELSESFGHPETYRELLRFYQVRNISGSLAMRRAQRLWELTADAADPVLWQTLSRSFDPQPPWRREGQWSPNPEFLTAVWRAAGERSPSFGMKLAEQHYFDDRESLAADILIEVIKHSEPSVNVVTRCIEMLQAAKRTDEAGALIQQFKGTFAGAPRFAAMWAKRALRTKSESEMEELTSPPWSEAVRPSLRALLYIAVGRSEDATGLADAVLKDLHERGISREELEELGGYFRELGKLEEFESVVNDVYPEETVRHLRRRRVYRPR